MPPRQFALKITGLDCVAKTFDAISVLSTAETEIQTGTSGTFIVSEGSKVKVMVGIVKADGVYNYTARAAADAKKAKAVGALVLFGGVVGLIFPPVDISPFGAPCPFFASQPFPP